MTALQLLGGLTLKLNNEEGEVFSPKMIFSEFYIPSAQKIGIFAALIRLKRT